MARIPKIGYYTALLNQSGTQPPTPTILHNTIGELTFTRQDVGVYSIYLPNPTLYNKLLMPNATIWNGDQSIIIPLYAGGITAPTGMVFITANTDGDYIELISLKTLLIPIEGIELGDLIADLPFEIRIYK